MKEKPICAISNCNNSALVVMNDTYYCGDCVVKMDRINKERARKEMEEMLK